MDFLVKILLGIVPGIAWMLVFFIVTRRERSFSLWHLFVFFSWGALVTVPALLFEVGFESLVLPQIASPLFDPLMAIFLVAPIEEVVKFSLLRFGVMRRYTFTKAFDPLLAGAVIGLGFATIENIFLLFQESSLQILLIRSVTATLLHAGTTAIVGLYLALAQRDTERRVRFILQGLFIASLFHGAYNFIMTLGASSALVLALILLAGIFLFLALALPYLRHTNPIEKNS